MAVPPQITQWVDKNHKRPRIDPEWLNECYEWLITEGGHNPNTNLQGLLDAVEHQILESTFSDSMLPGTGLPTHAAVPTTTTVLKGLHILVEVISITEIANSAFNLNQTRMAREERMKAGDADDEEGEGDIEVEGEGPMPKYSRGMLKFQLYDGTTTLPAIEYRSLPELSLENTPLGFKMILKDVTIRRGIAWLEPKSVILIGHKTDDRDEHRQTDFAGSLRARMGLPEPEPEAPASENNAQRPAQALDNQPQRHIQHNPPEIRSPLREISPPPSPPFIPHINDDEDLEPRRRRIPSQVANTPVPVSSTALIASSSGSTTQKINASSSYFTGTETTTATRSTVNLVMSPPRRATRPLFIKTPPPSPPHNENFWSDDEIPKFNDENVVPQNSGVKGKEKEEEPALSSDGFGDDSMDLDPVFLARLDTVEREAYSRTEKILPAPSTTSSRSGSLALGGQSQTSAVGVRSAASRNAGQVIDVIIIEDDEEEDDKENSPVPTRHVRRRTEDRGGGFGIRGPPPSQRAREPGRPAILARTASDVIELSDSD